MGKEGGSMAAKRWESRKQEKVTTQNPLVIPCNSSRFFSSWRWHDGAFRSRKPHSAFPSAAAVALRGQRLRRSHLRDRVVSTPPARDRLLGGFARRAAR